MLYSAYPLTVTPVIVTFCDLLSNFRKNTTKNITKPEKPLIVTFFVIFLKQGVTIPWSLEKAGDLIRKEK